MLNSIHIQVLQVLLEVIRHLIMLKCYLNIGFQVTDFTAAIETTPFEAVGKDLFLFAQLSDRIGQLDLITGATLGGF